MSSFRNLGDSASIRGGPQVAYNPVNPASQTNTIDKGILWNCIISRPVNLGLSLLVASLWVLFAYNHIKAFSVSDDWTYLLVAGSETLAAAFLVFRSAPDTVSNDPFDWFFGIAGTFIPLLLIPASWGLLPLAKNLIVLGFGLQILGLISLNRSLAIVAAKRTIKTSGMYKFVRHPLYAAYLVIFTGYILANTTVWNSAIYCLTIGLLLTRIAREEKHLLLDPVYAEYAQRVRWRILPYAY